MAHAAVAHIPTLDGYVEVCMTLWYCLWYSYSCQRLLRNHQAENFFETLSKPALKGLTIAASTVAVVELLKQDYSVGVSAAISWLLLVIASKRIFK